MRLLTFASGKISSVFRSIGDLFDTSARLFPQRVVDDAVMILRARNITVPADATDIVSRASELLGPDFAAMCARIRVGPIADLCTEETYSLAIYTADLYAALRHEAEAIQLKNAS